MKVYAEIDNLKHRSFNHSHIAVYTDATCRHHYDFAHSTLFLAAGTLEQEGTGNVAREPQYDVWSIDYNIHAGMMKARVQEILSQPRWVVVARDLRETAYVGDLFHWNKIELDLAQGVREFYKEFADGSTAYAIK